MCSQVFSLVASGLCNSLLVKTVEGLIWYFYGGVHMYIEAIHELRVSFLMSHDSVETEFLIRTLGLTDFAGWSGHTKNLSLLPQPWGSKDVPPHLMFSVWVLRSRFRSPHLCGKYFNDFGPLESGGELFP